jgi:hypothetical protein
MGTDLDRRLGTFEHFLWTTDQWAPRHFVIVARVEANLNPAQLESALAHAQRRHPVLRSGISSDGGGLRFVNTDATIPLRIVNNDSANRWLTEAQAELARPFEMAPLLRCVAVRDRTVTEIILAVNHAIGDGLSAMYLLRDLLQVLQGKTLVNLPPRPSLEELFGEGSSLPAVPPHSPSSAGKLRRLGQPMVSSFTIEPDQAQTILTRCKQERTTLQGALIAAAMISLDCSVVRCLAPISVRQLCPPIEDDFGLYISSGLADFEHQAGLDFWSVARRARTQLIKAFEPQILRSRFAMLSALLAANRDPQALYEAYRNSVTFDLVLSNLGKFSARDQSVILPVTALYLMLNAELEPSIGIATANGQLCVSVTFDVATRLEWFRRFEHLLRSISALSAP